MRLLIFSLVWQPSLLINLLQINQNILQESLNSYYMNWEAHRCQVLLTKLKNWQNILSEKPLFFENPFANFKAVKTLALDIPRICKPNPKKKTTYKKHVKDSIAMVIDVVKTYNMERETVFASIPDIDSSDCFVFCKLALKFDADENTLVLAEEFFEKGISLQQQFPEEVAGQRNRRLMGEAKEELIDQRNYIKFKRLCTEHKETYSIKNNGKCKAVLTPSWRVSKVQVLNENPLIEVYEEFLSEQEIGKFSKELSQFSFEAGTTANNFGISENVTFKEQKDIYNTENKVVDHFQKVFDDHTGLYPDSEDYIQVLF